MKNSNWLFFLGVILLVLLLPYQSHAQEAVQASTGIFSKIGSWVQSKTFAAIIGMIGAFFAGKGWTFKINKIASKGAVVMKELGEFCGDSATFLICLDEAIKQDGTIAQNSVQEVLDAGKEVIGELKHVTISIKPK